MDSEEYVELNVSSSGDDIEIIASYHDIAVEDIDLSIVLAVDGDSIASVELDGGTASTEG